MDQEQISAQAAVLPEFLSGGGEMGQRIREFDWSKTTLGPVNTWPQSLRTCVRIMLTSRQPIWIGWGRELIKLYNDPYKAIVGGKHPQALGTPVSIVWKDIWRDIDPMLKKVMNEDEGTYVESQLLIMERNGYPEETYYTFSYTPVPGDDGRPAGMICFNVDNTDRIISERQLKTLTQLGKKLTNCQANEEVIENTIASLKENPYDFPYALFYSIKGDKIIFPRATDPGIITTVPAEIGLFDNTPLAASLRDSLLTRELRQLDDVETHFGVMPQGAWPTSSNKAIILPIVQASSKEPYGVLIIGTNPYRLFNEKYSSFFSLVADQMATSFADVHVLEEERKRSEALAEIDRAKTIFFSNISHEFRTPLTLLLAPIEDVLHDNTISEEHKARMNVAYRNALRMQKLVNTLLEFSRLEAGRVEGRFSPVDIRTLTEDLASLFRSAIEKVGMHLIINKGDVRDAVYVDVEMWERIILNLISNAFKYSKEGTICLNIQQKEKDVYVSVSDTGIGIPEDQLDKVFDRFHRVENTEGRSQEGTGIGLAMVKELVKLHHGTIDVTSEPGKGSTFTVKIPVGKEHLPAEKIADTPAEFPIYKHSAAFVQEALKWVPEEKKQSIEIEDTGNIVAGGTPKFKVLLADDNADMQDYVYRLLSDQFIVITASDGEEAFQKALEHKPDLILSDIMMPKLDGFGLLKKLRNHSEIKNIPVIFLSARAGEEAKVEGLDAGADDYLIKPFSAKELIVRVNNHIRINKVRRETEEQFYQLFMQAPTLINVFKGPDFIFELFHPKNKELFGDVDFTGMPIREALPELEGQGVFELLEEVYRTGKVIHQNEQYFFFNTKTGRKERYFNFTYQPWLDIRGQIQGVLTFSIDVTEAVENRKKIEKSEKQFRNVLLNAPSIFLILTGPDMVISFGNEPLFRSWAKTSNIIGKTLLEVLPELKDQPFPQLLNKVFSTGEPHYGYEEKAVLIENGQPREVYYNYFYQPIIEPDATISGVTVMASDVTEQVVARKKIEESEKRYRELSEELEVIVKKRTKELQRSNDDLLQFAHVASHDLKEPVRKFKTFIGRLQDEYNNILPDKGKDYLYRMELASDRMSAMIEGVLKYSSLNGTDQINISVDLNEIIKSIEADLEVIINQKKAQIFKDELPTIEGAPVLIYQLFYNLINNSLKFSTEKPVVRITSSVEMSDGKKYAKILVADNGIGFGQEHAIKIFNAFSRLNTKDKYEGTGLGLALCKKIVERHRGSIYATSEEGKGAVFSILLPI